MKPRASEDGPRRPGRPAGARPGQTREELLRAARTLMSERGLPRVTTREVALRANVNPALVNYYFGGKLGLLRAVVDQVAEESRARTLRWSSQSGDFRTRMRGLIAAMIQGFFDDPYSPRLIFEQVLFAEEDDAIDRFVDEFAGSHVDALRSLLEDGQASGECCEIDAESAVAAITGASIFFFLGAPVFNRVFEHETLTPEFVERFTDSVVTLVLDGIGRG